MSHVISNLRRWLLGFALVVFGALSPLVAASTSGSVNWIFDAAHGGAAGLEWHITGAGAFTHNTTDGWSLVWIQNDTFDSGSIGMHAVITYADGHTVSSDFVINHAQTTPHNFPVNAGSMPTGVVVTAKSDYVALGASGTMSITLSDDPIPQTCTLSPDGGAGSIVSGQSFTGTASGAQAGNPYNISIISGPGSAAINATTGAYSITATGGGLIHYKVWISEGGGYSRSADAESNVAAAASKKVKVTIPANNGKYPVLYKLYQDGAEIGSYLQAPGAIAHIVVIDVGANDGPVTMKSYTSGITVDDGVIVEDVNGVVEETSKTVITPSTDPQTVTPDPAQKVVKPGDSVSKLPRTKVVWGASGQSDSPSAQTDIVTNKTYREGVEKQLEKPNIELDLADNRPTTSDMQSAGQAAKDQAEHSLDTVGTTIGVGTPPSDDATGFNVAGQYSTMIANAWQQAVIGVSPAVAWLKALIRWAIAILYCMWVYKEIEHKLVTSMMLPQAKGNPVLGGTGAQLTGLAAAGLITVALLTVPVLLWSAYTTPWESVGDALSSIPSAPITTSVESVNVALRWLTWCLPVDMLLAIPALVVTTKKAGWAIILGVAAVIRFIVP